MSDVLGQDAISTAAVTALRPTLACARAAGVDTDALLSELRIDASNLDDPDVRIPDDLHDRVWRECAARSGDELFGLHAAPYLDVGSYDALYYAMWSSQTLSDALQRLERFHRIICGELAMTLGSHGGATYVRRPTEAHGRHEIEFFLAAVIHVARALTARPIVPQEVRCTHAAPPDVAPFVAFFGCPVRFGCVVTELLLEDADLALSVTTARPQLAAVLDRYLRECMARLPQRESFVERVRRAVVDTLSKGQRPSLIATARALRSSPRTMQRKLVALGTSHREQLDSIRRELARTLLDERRMSVTETAFMLGFSDLSGFQRAFRRWYGHSPTRGAIRTRGAAGV